MHMWTKAISKGKVLKGPMKGSHLLEKLFTIRKVEPRRQKIHELQNKAGWVLSHHDMQPMNETYSRKPLELKTGYAHIPSVVSHNILNDVACILKKKIVFENPYIRFGFKILNGLIYYPSTIKILYNASTFRWMETKLCFCNVCV